MAAGFKDAGILIAYLPVKAKRMQRLAPTLCFIHVNDQRVHLRRSFDVGKFSTKLFTDEFKVRAARQFNISFS